MSMTDPIADFLTRIRNALGARHGSVSMASSRMKEQLARILEEEGYIKGWSIEGEAPKRSIRLELKYGTDGEPAIQGLERVSRPGCRVYKGAGEVPRVLNGLGVSIVSTSEGVLSDASARSRKVGGEVLASVW